MARRNRSIRMYLLVYIRYWFPPAARHVDGERRAARGWRSSPHFYGDLSVHCVRGGRVTLIIFHRRECLRRGYENAFPKLNTIHRSRGHRRSAVPFLSFHCRFFLLNRWVILARFNRPPGRCKFFRHSQFYGNNYNRAPKIPQIRADGNSRWYFSRGDKIARETL